MGQQAVNTFNEGINFDLNPITTPNNVLTDCINGAFLTFNGDELALQNDAGNTKIEISPGSGTYVELSSGFYPLGIKEYGGILYIISGKLPDVLAGNITTYIEGTNYTAETIVFESLAKLFYEKKITGIHALPLINSNIYWDLIGTEIDYNNKYGKVEIGSYPSPSESNKRLFDGDLVLYNNTEVITNYRWYPTGITSCIVGIDLRKTGFQNVEEKLQSSVDNIIWNDVIGEPYRTSIYYNTTICPIPYNWIGISVDPTAYNIIGEVSITYVENTIIPVNTPIKSGYNYVFLSIPQNKTFSIKDSLGNDITNSFVLVGTDDRVIHTINNIYKKTDAFATDLSTTYYLTIF